MAQHSSIFVTGTDTGIGKTVVCSLLLSACKQQGWNVNYFKPIQTGIETDRDELVRLVGVDLQQLPEPVYFLTRPASPLVAAQAEGVCIELRQIVDRYGQLTAVESEGSPSTPQWIVEGCGGLLVPLNAKESIRDLVRQLQLPLLIVASTRLGTLNHILLTAEAARAAGIPVRGVVLVGNEEPGLREAIATFSGFPVLAQVPQMPQVQEGGGEAASIRDCIQGMAREVFPSSVLVQVFHGAL